jgi:type IV fimbrial biogenesis protein FimT
MKPHPFPPTASGFTLIELVVAMAILGILLALAAPSFRDAMMNVRLTGAANDLMTDLSIARSEAVKRDVQTAVCASNDQKTCTGNPWEKGWIVMVDSDGDGQPDAPGPLKVTAGITGDTTLKRTDAGGATPSTRVAFGAGGMAVGGQATGSMFELCDSRKMGRNIWVTATGRASVKVNNSCTYP